MDRRRVDARLALVVFVRLIAAVFMAAGLRNWASIVGLDIAGGDLLARPLPLVVVTLFFAVADLVAAVGLWLLASWGTVVWMISALTECILHGLFSAQFGYDVPLIVFHVITVSLYGLLLFWAERARAP